MKIVTIIGKNFIAVVAMEDDIMPVGEEPQMFQNQDKLLKKWYDKAPQEEKNQFDRDMEEYNKGDVQYAEVVEDPCEIETGAVYQHVALK